MGGITMIQLTTDRLLVCDPEESDLMELHELLSDKVAMYYLDDISTVTLEESKENLKASMSGVGKSDRKNYFFKILKKENHEFIGQIGYTVLYETPMGKIVGMGYFIKPKFWGQGITTEAVREVMRFAFEDNNVFKIETGCNAENINSEKIMKKVGMTKEAEFKFHLFHDGRLKDRVEYRMLRDEWSKL